MRETVAMRKIISTLPNAAKFACNEHQVTHICTHAVIPNRTVNTLMVHVRVQATLNRKRT